MARDQLIFLDGTREHDRVIDYNVPESIPAGCLRLTVGKRKREIALYPLKSIWRDVINGNEADFEICYGKIGVIEGKIAIQNVSEDIWKIYDPNIRQITSVAKGQAFTVMPGMQIQFNKRRNIIGVVDDPKINGIK